MPPPPIPKAGPPPIPVSPPPIPNGSGGMGGPLALSNALKAVEFAIPIVVKEVMHSGMEEIVTEAVKSTPPFIGGQVGTGGDAGAIKDGNQQLEDEINKVFKPVKSVQFGQLVANKDWDAMAAYGMKFKHPHLQRALNDKNIKPLEAAFLSKRNYTQVQSTYLSDMNGMASVHRQSRGKDGRIMKQRQGAGLVNDKKLISDYLLVLQGYVGKMIGGWYKAAAGLGFANSKSPFVNQGEGKGEYKVGKDEFSITVENKFGNFNGMLERNMDCQGLVDKKAKEMEAEVERRLGDIAKQHGFTLQDLQ